MTSPIPQTGNLMGDSCAAHLFEGTYFPTVLQTRWANLNNYGISDSTVSRVPGHNAMVDRIGGMTTNCHQEIFWGGLNDKFLDVPLATFRTQYAEALDLYLAIGKPVCVFTPHWVPDHADGDYDLVDLVDVIIEECASRSIPCVDFFRSGLVNAENWTEKLIDRFHPGQLLYDELFTYALSQIP